MNFKLYFCSILVILGANFNLISQTKSKLIVVRSTIGSSSVNKNVPSNFKTSAVMQSIGQSSVIGSFSSNYKVFRQGYIQPQLLLNSLNLDKNLKLQLNLYPNPFTDYFTLSFQETVYTSIRVDVFDLLGRKVFEQIFELNQTLTISNWENTTDKNYVLKVTANNKEFVSHLLHF